MPARRFPTCMPTTGREDIDEAAPVRGTGRGVASQRFRRCEHCFGLATVAAQVAWPCRSQACRLADARRSGTRLVCAASRLHPSPGFPARKSLRGAAYLTGENSSVSITASASVSIVSISGGERVGDRTLKSTWAAIPGRVGCWHTCPLRLRNSSAVPALRGSR